MLLDMLFSFPPRAIPSGEGGERRIGSRNPSSNYDFPPSRGKRGRKKKISRFCIEMIKWTNPERNNPTELYADIFFLSLFFFYEFFFMVSFYLYFFSVSLFNCKLDERTFEGNGLSLEERKKKRKSRARKLYSTFSLTFRPALTPITGAASSSFA